MVEDSVVIVTLVLVLVGCFSIMVNSELVGDENAHFEYINNYYKGNFTTNPDLTVIPGYHFLTYGITTLTGMQDKKGLRTTSFVISLITVMMFYAIAKRLDKNPQRKLLKFAFLPILFPFMFLIFTDILSLLLVLLSFYLITNKRYTASGIVGILSLLIRQNNIIWLGMIAGIALVEYSGYEINKKTFKFIITKLWSFILALVLFSAFVIKNKGVALGDSLMHKPGIHFTNIYYMLFLMFFLFIATHIRNYKLIWEQLKKRNIQLALAAFLVVFMITFTNTHPYNIDWGNYFLRNYILIMFTSGWQLKLAFFIPVALATLSLYVTKLHHKAYYLLYPFTLIALIPMWLVNQRYYFVPFAFFILFKEERTKWTEIATIILFITLSAVVFFLFQGNFYLL